MRYFHDSERNQWELTLNLGAAKRVYDALGVDLLNPSQESDDGRAITIRLAFDDFLLGRVVAEMIAPQAKARQLSRDELDALFDARTLAAAEKAFFAEWRDFFTQRYPIVPAALLSGRCCPRRQTSCSCPLCHGRVRQCCSAR
ncbi:MAG: hypothetical protein IJO46_10435 [Thermoguttaceae bacterium]|nr:hypothetical protein [Thermoguttaceae bacterium]